MFGDRELKRTLGKSAGRTGISEAPFHGPGIDRKSVETVRVMSASVALSLRLAVCSTKTGEWPRDRESGGPRQMPAPQIVVDPKADLSAEQLTELFLTHQIETEIEKTGYEFEEADAITPWIPDAYKVGFEIPVCYRKAERVPTTGEFRYRNARDLPGNVQERAIERTNCFRVS